LKKITAAAQAFGMLIAVLIFTGQVSIDYRNKIEYLVVISSILFIWTFVYDFKRFKMDVDRIPKVNNVQPVVLNNVGYQMNQNVIINEDINGQWNGQQRVNIF